MSPRQLCYILAILAVSCGIAVAAQAPPNVIVVMTDDQGYGEFSCHGNPLTDTPNIDQLARQSVRLTDFHVAPMCTPTRGQLMTGLDAFRNGAINVSSGRALLRPELKTMADVFRAAAYRTGIFGKWHLGDNYPFRPEDRGFDEALWFPSSHISSAADYWNNDYFDGTYIHNGRRQPYDGYCTDIYFGEAIKWMQHGDRSRPFFAYIPLNAVHAPWFVPDHYREAIRESMAAHPDVVKHLPPDQRENLVSFLAMGANVDENMGRLDEFLIKSGLMDNTVVVFLTDNGSTLGPRYFNAGMRGGKTTLWEGGHRVPCFIRWPDGLGQPRDVAELTHVQDLLPTLANLAGAAKYLPAYLDGQNLAPLLRGEDDALEERMLVINYSRMPQFRVTYTDGNPAIPQKNGAAVLWKRWRLLENRELYNLDADPHQDHDVASQHPEVVAKMRAYLNDWWRGVQDRVLEPQRVILGNSAENPLMLSACEWLDVFVDQQRQIRLGVKKNGAWHVTVAEPATYEFELRRWPKESGLKLHEGCDATKVTDGRYLKGEPLPITQARLQIGETFEETRPVADDPEAVRFRANLSSGPTTVQTWMLDSTGNELCGAYYVYVRRTE